MASPNTNTDTSLDPLLGRIRRAVRDESEYVVGAPSEPRIKLNQNESPYDLPPELKEDIAERLLDIPFNRYPNEQPNRLRRALADYTGHDADGIIVGNGSNEITYTFGLALLEPGTPAVLPRPMFSLYAKVVRINDGELIEVAPREDLSFDTDALVEAVRTHDPALTVVTSPNNPTGQAVSLDEIERIVAASSGFVVVDEAYVEFNPEESALSLMDTYSNVIILRTFSKGFGLAGLRIGYLMAQPDVARELMKARLPFMVDRLAEAAALELLDRPELIEERINQMEASRRTLSEALRAMEGVDVVPSQANFVLFKTEHPSSELQQALADQGVVIRDMSGYDELSHYVRVNAGTKAENKAFLGALERTL